MVSKKCAFFDRDGIVNIDDGYVYKISEFKFQNGIFEILKFFKERDFALVLVTNQSGIARGYYGASDVEILHKFMQEKLFENLGFGFDKIYFCPHMPQTCECRKPNVGMIKKAISDFQSQNIELDLSSSVLIGDNITDIQCAQNAGIFHKFLLNDSSNDELQIPDDFDSIFSNAHIIENLNQIKQYF